MINAPVAKKYQYWTNDKTARRRSKNGSKAPRNIRARGGRTGTSGCRKLSGKKIPARKPGDGKLQTLGDAPGSYVKIKAA